MIDTLASALALAPTAASSATPRVGTDAAALDADPGLGGGLFAKALAKARQPGAPADDKAPRQDVLPREGPVDSAEPETEPRPEPAAAGSDELTAAASTGIDPAWMAAVWPAPAVVTPGPVPAPSGRGAAAPIDALQLQPGVSTGPTARQAGYAIDGAPPEAVPLSAPATAVANAAAGTGATAHDALGGVDPQTRLAADAARAGRAQRDTNPAADGEARDQAAAPTTALTVAANEAERSAAQPQALVSAAAAPGTPAATLASAAQPTARAASSVRPVEASAEGDEPSPRVAMAALPTRPQRGAATAAAAATRAQTQTASDAVAVADNAARGSAATSLEARHAARDDKALPVAATSGGNSGAAAAPAPPAAPSASLPAAGAASMPAPTASAPAPGAEGPAFTAQLSPHVASPAFAPALGVQLTMLVKNGIGQAQLNLNPADMGPIAVRIELEGRQAQVMLAADHLQTRGVLEQALPSLASAMNDAGFTLSGGGVSQQGAWAGQNGQPGQDGFTSASAAARRAAGAAVAAADDGSVGTRQVLPGPRGLVDLVA